MQSPIRLWTAALVAASALATPVLAQSNPDREVYFGQTHEFPYPRKFLN